MGGLVVVAVAVVEDEVGVVEVWSGPGNRYFSVDGFDGCEWRRGKTSIWPHSSWVDFETEHVSCRRNRRGSAAGWCTDL